MKQYGPSDVKNFVILGNTSSGKTILTESILFDAGQLQRRGSIEQKNTASDFYEIEHLNSHSYFSSVFYAEWNNKKLNFIDLPGLDDFSGHTFAAFSVCDFAVLLVNAKNGAEVGTEIQSRYIKKYNKPSIVAVNELDAENANFEKSVEDTKRLFGKKTVIIQYPINQGTDFNSIIDIIEEKMFIYKNENGEYIEEPIPDSEKEKVEELKSILTETIAENDDKLIEKFFENGYLDKEDTKKAIKLGLIKNNFIPMFSISAKKNIGVRNMLSFISEYAPSPSDMPAPKNTENVEILCKEDEHTSLFVFKANIEPHLGEVIYFKVMSGKLSEGMDLINTSRNSKERIAQLFTVSGKNRVKVNEILAGDIGVTVKLKDIKSSQTINEKSLDWTYPVIEYPNPRFRIAVKTKVEGEEEKLAEALHRLNLEDPTLIVEYSKELKQLIVHGQGENHLNIMKWQMQHIFKIEVDFIQPKIPYRETVTEIAQASYRHKKQSGGSGQFGEVHIFIEPYEEGKDDKTQFKNENQTVNVSIRDRQEINLEWGGKLVFLNCIVGGVIETRFLPAILKGLMEKMEEGPLTGSYARDIKVYVYDGKMHPVDSNEISFKIAGMNAFKDAFKKAAPKIMEPIYSVEIIVPDDRMGDVMSDLQGRRSVIMGMNAIEEGYEKISAQLPLAELSHYSTSLSSLTNGKGTYNMAFLEYQQVPREEQEVLLKKYEETQKEE